MTDDREPKRHAVTRVIITVMRNEHAPEFQGEPYATELSESEPIGASVFTTVARDRDIQASKHIPCICYSPTVKLGI